MTEKSKRDLLNNVTKPQQRILIPFYVACLLVCVCLVYFDYLIFRHPLLLHPEYYLPPIEDQQFLVIKKTMILLTVLISTSLLFLVYWAYVVSNRILGPYERILRELDKMIEEKKGRPLKVRSQDEMFGELLQRINKLMASLSSSKSGGETKGYMDT